MSDSALLPSAPDAVILLDPVTVLGAVSDPVRYTLLRTLADGAQLNVNELAARVGRPADSISKHLRVLRDARIIRAVDLPGADGRKQHHEIPALFRTKDAAGQPLADFGAVVLRFG